MNIAIMIPTLAAGGAERVASIVGDFYSEKGHNVYFFLFETHYRQFYRVKGQIVNTHILSPFLYSSKRLVYRELLFLIKRIKTLKREYRIDVTISFMEECNCLNVYSAVGDKKITTVHTVLSKRNDFNGYVYDRKWIKRYLNKSDVVVSVSSYIKKDLIEKYKPIMENKI